MHKLLLNMNACNTIIFPANADYNETTTYVWCSGYFLGVHFLQFEPF